MVTYTDPTAGDDANAIQDIAGNDTATFTTGVNGVPAVTNNSTVDTTPPTLTSVTVSPVGDIIRFAFSENLNRPVPTYPLHSAFAVTVGDGHPHGHQLSVGTG